MNAHLQQQLNTLLIKIFVNLLMAPHKKILQLTMTKTCVQLIRNEKPEKQGPAAAQVRRKIAMVV